MTTNFTRSDFDRNAVSAAEWWGAILRRVSSCAENRHDGNPVLLFVWLHISLLVLNIVFRRCIQIRGTSVQALGST